MEAPAAAAPNARRTACSSSPPAGSTSTTRSAASVNVPVLSIQSVPTEASDSIASTAARAHRGGTSVPRRPRTSGSPAPSTPPGSSSPPPPTRLPPLCRYPHAGDTANTRAPRPARSPAAPAHTAHGSPPARAGSEDGQTTAPPRSRAPRNSRRPPRSPRRRRFPPPRTPPRRDGQQPGGRRVRKFRSRLRRRCRSGGSTRDGRRPSGPGAGAGSPTTASSPPHQSVLSNARPPTPWSRATALRSTSPSRCCSSCETHASSARSTCRASSRCHSAPPLPDGLLKRLPDPDTIVRGCGVDTPGQ